MNTHIPQNIETMIELRQITSVPTQIIKPATSKPVIMAEQDSVVGAYLMTLPKTKISKRQLFNLLMTNQKFNGILPESKDGFWRGQDLYSMFLPDVSITKGNNLYEDNSVDDNKIIIKNGQFLQGIMDSSVLQKPLLHLIFNTYGPLEARDFLDNNQRTVSRWLEQHGFTLGYGDCAPTQEMNENVEEKIKEKIKNVNTFLKEANMGIYKSNLDKKFIKFALENDILAELEGAKYEAHKFIRKHITTKNNMYVASKDVSGTKGSSGNIGQVMGTLGQQVIQGKRVPFSFTKRTLPFFARDDYSAESRGFVKGSFFNGMNPVETFFHQMGGRMGNIDTAIRTADSGYMQRRLIKALEDLYVKYGGTVRDGTNNIIQFSYGDDGIDPTKLEQQKMDIMRLNNEELEKYYKITDGDMKNMKSIMTKEAYQEISKMNKKVFDEEYEMIKSFRDDARYKYFKNINIMDNTVFCAINFIGIIASAKDRFKIQLNMKTDLTPSLIQEKIEDILKSMEKYLPEISLNMFKILIYSHLSYKKAILYHRLNKSVFTFIIDTIKERYMSSLVQAGEMVGIIAAQSIGEPLTQMSVPSDTKVIVRKDGEVEKMEIGELIDGLIEEKNGELFVDETKTHNILDLNDEIEILSVSKEEKNSWKKISKVSRHPVNGGLMKVTTRSGKTTKATLSHSFLKRVEDGIEPVLGSELKVGQRIPVTKNIPVISNPKMKLMLEREYELNREFGYFCGIYLANGTTVRGNMRLKIDERLGQKLGMGMVYKNSHFYCENKDFVEKLTEKFMKKSGEKIIPGFVFGSNLDFIGGLVSGYIESNGSIDKNKNFVRVSSVNENLLNDICLLLAYVGIFGVRGYDKRSGKSFYLHLSKKYAKTYFEKIGFYLPENIECVEDIMKYNERDDAHDVADYIDKIPAVGELIGDCGRLLGIEGHSRLYGRWKNKESIGRRTLEKYIEVFKSYGEHQEVKPKLEILEQAVKSDVVWDEIIKIDYYDGGNEYVYDFTVPGTESFMVDTGILVHNTLNSVEWNTEILIKEDDILSRKKIGEWIDERIAKAKEIEEHPNDTKLEYIKDKKIFVPACREDGKVIWDEVEAVTKHPVINKDGTNTLLKITTQYGREVIATKAKSFLKRVNNKIIGVDGEELKVGDYLPVSKNIIEENDVKYLDLEKYLPKSEFIYTDEVKKAIEISKDKNRGRLWWKEHYSKDFIVPYGRPDSFNDAFVKENSKRNIEDFNVGCVYPKNGNYEYHIPAKLPLDELTGFLFGAYLSEGHGTKYQTLISNINEDFLDKIREFADRYNIKYHYDDRIVNNGRSKTIRLHSYVLSSFMNKAFGTHSQNKRIPVELIDKNIDFIKGLLNGYYSGDGYIPIKENSILVTSVSRNLLEDIRLLLLRFDINSSIGIQKASHINAIKNGFKAQLPYELRVHSGYTEKFASIFNLVIKEKDEKLKLKKSIRNTNRNDTIPNVITKQWGDINILRNSLDKFIKKSKYEEDKRILENIKEEDVYYDKIINIEEIVSNYPYVYDLTVKETRNFNIFNGLCMRDTFHSAGQGASSIITTSGIPRVKEIINVAKTIKTPAMFIYLKEEYNHDIEKAKQVLSQIEFTKLQDIVDKTMILYERKNSPNHYKEDIEFIQTYQDFAKIIGFNQCPDEDLSNWVLRVIFNKEKMMNKKIYLKDIQDVIMRNDRGDDVQCVFSDDNAKELMMRIKVREDKIDGDYIDFLKELEKVLMSITIRGIPNVEKVEPAMLKKLDYSPDGTYKQNTEWFLGTIGVNLLDVLINDSVDPTRTKSNDILEIHEIFGIEAVRNILIEELLTQLADYDINFRHISLLGDLMTHKGNIMPIERHGINRSADRGPIAKATFEESTEILVKASTFSEVDKMGGVSANVMFGQFPKVGTNAFDVLFDESKFLEEVAKLPKEKEVEKGDLMEDLEKELDELEDNSHLNDAFGFDLDVTKNAQTALTPHIFPEGGFQVKGNKKTIKIKKKLV